VRIHLIAAVADNGVIGRDGDLPWRLPADLKRFKAWTMGHPILMGRRTWESIGRPLPGRRSIVLTRGDSLKGVAGVETAGNLEEALALAAESGNDVFVIGGAAIYREALPRAHRLILTRVHGEVEGDTHFPAFDSQQWRLVESEPHPADERHAYPMTFELYERNDS
jgi:dihydrofolate reductase